jgi:hypothetical protein
MVPRCSAGCVARRRQRRRSRLAAVRSDVNTLISCKKCVVLHSDNGYLTNCQYSARDSCFIISHVLMESSADPLDARPLKYVHKIWVDLPTTWRPISMNNDIRTLFVLNAILVPMIVAVLPVTGARPEGPSDSGRTRFFPVETDRPVRRRPAALDRPGHSRPLLGRLGKLAVLTFSLTRTQTQVVFVFPCTDCTCPPHK